jgi:hypothetical protein
VDDLVDSAGRDVDVSGEPVLADAKRLQELLKQDLAWMGRRQL